MAGLRDLEQGRVSAPPDAQAIPVLREVRERYQHTHIPADEAGTLALIGDGLAELGSLAEAKRCWQQALATLRELRHPYAEAVSARLAQRFLDDARATAA